MEGRNTLQGNKLELRYRDKVQEVQGAARYDKRTTIASAREEATDKNNETLKTWLSERRLAFALDPLESTASTVFETSPNSERSLDPPSIDPSSISRISSPPSIKSISGSFYVRHAMESIHYLKKGGKSCLRVVWRRTSKGRVQTSQKVVRTWHFQEPAAIVHRCGWRPTQGLIPPYIYFDELNAHLSWLFWKTRRSTARSSPSSHMWRENVGGRGDD